MIKLINSLNKVVFFFQGLFYGVKLKRELSRMNPKKISFQNLSNQHYQSDLIYNLPSAVGGICDKNLVFLLNKLIGVSSSETIQKDITTLYGSRSGKSRSYRNIDMFAKNVLKKDYEGARKINFKTDKDWQDNITSFQQTLNRPGIIYSYFNEWNDRWFLDNGDGSHHIAAIYRQAKEQHRLFEIICDCRTLYIKLATAEKLNNNYHCFVISCEQREVDYMQYFLRVELNKLAFSTNNLPNASISAYQRFEGCQEYAYFFITRNTWTERIIYSYFSELQSLGKAINLTELIKK
jgi:hypothetical protein